MTRELLIITCSPTVSPLYNVDDEASDVSCQMAAAIKRAGTAQDLRKLLSEKPTRRFLFIGHGDANFDGKYTLGFADSTGQLEVLAPETLRSVISVHAPPNGDLQLVFLNGCKTKALAEACHDAGIPTCVGWATRVETSAARLFSREFFRSIKNGASYSHAFQEAENELRVKTRPGKNGDMNANVSMYTLADPDAPVACSSFISPAPIRAGVPILLHREQAAPTVHRRSDPVGTGDSRPSDPEEGPAEPALVSLERDGRCVMCLLPPNNPQPITLSPTSTLAELRSAMADSLDKSDLPSSFRFEYKITMRAKTINVRCPLKQEEKLTIDHILPDEDHAAAGSSQEAEHALWRRQLLTDLEQKDVRLELRDGQDLLELGSGKFGVVRELKLAAARGGNILAVKTIPKRLILKATDAEDVVREVRIHATLAATGVAGALYGVYEDTGSSGPDRLGLEHGLHLVSQRADFDLHQLIVKHAPLPERFAATLCLELLRAVHAAHEVNVALLDVKPENFLLVTAGASTTRHTFGTVPERAALDMWMGSGPAPYRLIATDFGTSQYFDSNTRFSRIVGSPYYIAPEVVHRSYSAECDLWSIGVILHQLLTGRSPFEAATLQESVGALLDFELTRTLDAPALKPATISAKAFLVQLLQVEPSLRATPSDALGACRSWRKIAPSGWPWLDGPPPIPSLKRQESGELPPIPSLKRQASGELFVDSE